MAFDWQVFWDALTSYLLFRGACVTVALTTISFICALIIAMPLALIISADSKWLKIPARIYIGLFRGAPTLLQLLFIWNALPQIAPIFREGWFTPFIAAAIALSLNESAYEVEIIRSSLLSVDKGQRDAAQALGLSKFQVLRLVILPQAL